MTAPQPVPAPPANAAQDASAVAGERDRPAYLLCLIGSVVASVLSGNSKLLHFPIGPDRVLLAAGLILLFLDPMAWRHRVLRLRPVHVLVSILIAVIAVSADLDGSLHTSLGFYALLDRITVPFVLMTVAPVVFCTPQRRNLLAQWLVGLGLYLGLTAIFEVFGPHALVFPRFIVDPNVGIGLGQARGPFTAPEADGLVMTCCAFIAVMVATRWTGRWRWAATATIAVDFLGAFVTLTRSIWVGFVVGAVVAGLTDPRLRPWLVRALTVGAVVIGLSLYLSPTLRSHTTERAGTSRSVYDRANTDDAALRILTEHPLTGIGWTRFPSESPNYVRQASTYPVTTVDIEIHNVVLSRATELGIPAALVFILALLDGPARGAWRRTTGDLVEWRLVLLGYGSCWLVVSMLSPLPYPLPNTLLWLLTGIALSDRLSRPRTLPRPPQRLHVAPPARHAVRWLPDLAWMSPPSRHPQPARARRPVAQATASRRRRRPMPRRPTASSPRA